MLNAIKNFFETRLLQSPATEEDSERTSRLAAAALMLEVAESDFKEKPEEKSLIKSLIQKSFNLSTQDATELFQLAERKVQSSTDDFEFTHLINQTYNTQQKIELIESLWRIAYADNIVDKYEDNFIRRIADLIYVSHRDFISSKLNIEKQSGSTT